MAHGKLVIEMRLRGEHSEVRKVRRRMFSYLHSLGFEPGGWPRQVIAEIEGSKEYVYKIRDTLSAMMGNAEGEGWKDAPGDTVEGSNA